MARPKGQPKLGGRVKGTPNKTTGVVRAALANIVGEYFNSETFLKDMAELEPKDRVAAMTKLNEYITPKLQATSLEVSANSRITIEDRLKSLSDDGEGE